MQLIEIIQLTLAFFIVLSAIIFLFSYLGYRTRVKKNESLLAPKISKMVTNQNFQIADRINNSPTSNKPEIKLKQSSRFEVFNPSSAGNSEEGLGKRQTKKSHSPKTLIIKNKS